MENVISPDKLPVLDRLLTELAGRVDGAVDFWTQVCFLPASVMPDRQAFVAKNCETLHSLVTRVTAILAEAGLGCDSQVRCMLDTMAHACQQLQDAFLVMMRFRTVPPEEVRLATESVAECHAHLMATIQQLGGLVGFPVAYWQQRTPEQEQYYQKILAGLFNLFRDARASEPHALASASST